MKVLIVGKNSYIGMHIKKYLKEYGHTVKTMNSRSDEWLTYDYTSIDSIIHVAAIVHQKRQVSWETYYNVNTVLPVNIALKAKEQGVKHFVFISTMGIYGIGKKLPDGSVITQDTKIAPVSSYGKSKREAEKKLEQLDEKGFNVSIVRPPNVYGKNCPGNYIKGFEMITKIFPIFPSAFTESRQSLLYIDNLTELILRIIETKTRGVFMPQDAQQLNTIQLLKLMAAIKGEKLILSKKLGFVINFFSRVGIVKKIYGGIQYDPSLSNHFEGKYQKVTIFDGVKNTLI